MKIAIYYFLKFGGAKRVVMDQAQYFKSKNNIVDIFTINHEKDFFDPEPFADKNFNYFFQTEFAGTPIVGKLIHLYYVHFKLRQLYKKIARDIDKKNYDVVIVHPDIYTQAPYLLRYLKTKSVYYCQEPYRISHEHGMRINPNFSLLVRLYEHIVRFFVKVADRNNVKKATRTIASSYSVRERMIQAYNVYPKVISPGINTEIFKKSSQKKRNNLLFVGNAKDPLDGYDLVDKALKLIPKNKRPTLEKVIWRKKNNERLTEKELAKIYSESKITMCMSRFETFGLIPLESMACGTPVIATKIGGHRETVPDGKAGYLVDPEPNEIADRIVALIHSPSYDKFSKYSEDYVKKNWSTKKKNEELLNYLKSIK